MRRNQNVVVTLTPKEFIVLRDCLLWWRNELIRKNLPTDDLDILLKRILK